MNKGYKGLQSFPQVPQVNGLVVNLRESIFTCKKRHMMKNDKRREENFKNALKYKVFKLFHSRITDETHVKLRV